MLFSRQQVSQVLGLLYDAAGDPSLWEPFIAELGRRTEATSAALVIHDFNHARCTVGTSWRLDPALVRLYQQHYHTLDTWAAQLSSCHSCECVTSESVLPIRDMRKTEFYNDFLVNSDIEHAMFVYRENSESRLAGISLYRDRSRSEFSESDLQVLSFVAPHLQRAFKLHFELSEAKAHSTGTESVLDMLPAGIVLMDSKGEIIFINKAATALFSDRDGLLVHGNRLRAESSAESARLTAIIDSAASISASDGISAGGSILISRRTRPPLQALITPIRNTMLHNFHRVAAVAFVNDPLRTHRPAEAVLRTLYGLTPAECRIALLLSDGRAPRQIAMTVGVTENTVRSQVKSIYAKTGVKRQSDLIRLFANHAGPVIPTKSNP